MRSTAVTLAAVAVLLVAAATASPAPESGGAPRLDAVWSTIEVSGGKAALCRVAGFSEHIESARLLLELIRLIDGEGLSEAIAEANSNAAVLGYLATVDEFTRAVAALRTPELSTSAARAGLRDMRPVMSVLGIDFDQKSPAPWHYLPHPDRTEAARRTLTDAGLSLDNLANRLNGGARISLELPRTTVPLPLQPSVWRDVILAAKVADNRLFAAIARDRTAALLYHGLMSLDPETLAYFGSHPGLLSMARHHPGAFCATVRSVHVREGHVLAPGGSAAEPLWAALVGARAAEADRFVRALFDDTGGRRAYFYDAIGHLDAAHQRFALGLTGAASPPDATRFRRLYDSFTGVFATWQIETHPFTRPIGDGLPLLAQLRVDATGRLSPPTSTALWRCAFDAGTLTAGRDPRAQTLPADAPADAAAIVEAVLGTPDRLLRRERVKVALFAQRVFGSRGPGDADAVCSVLRAVPRFEALALVIERMGIEDPALYMAAMKRAADLSNLAASIRPTALAQFQGALSLVDRLVVQETFDAAETRHLVDSLVAIPVAGDGYRGAVCEWVREQLLPALHGRMPQSAAASDEDLILEALAGTAPVVAAPPRTIDWEGERYRIDPAAAELTRLLRVRRKQNGRRIDDPLALYATGIALRRQQLAPAERERLVTTLTGLLKSMRSSSRGEVADGDGGAATDRPLEKLSEAVRRFTASPDSDERRLALAQHAIRAADDLAARVFRSLAYAVAIGSPDTNLFLGPDVALDHDFGLADSEWALPVEQTGSGIAWHLRGSLLGLDVPLARYSLRRVSSDAPFVPRRLDPEDEQGLAHAAVLKQTWIPTEAERDELVARIRRGRDRASHATTPADRAAMFDAANIDEWRRNVLLWETDHDRTPLAGRLALTELVWIGALPSAAPPRDAWGASMAALSGCLCLRFAGPATIDTLGIRPSLGVVSSYLADATLRAAEWTAQAKLPAALIPLLLPGLTQDVLDTAQPAHADDWLELAQAASRITRDRLEDQVAALTVAGGPLVPVASRAHEARSPDAQAAHRRVAAPFGHHVRPGA